MKANTMVKYRLFWSFEKEEAWLEEMSVRGWHLVKISAFSGYTFEKGAPEQRIYKIDFRAFKNRQDIVEYITLFEDSGWHCAARQVSGYNYYFYTQNDGMQKDIFSDQDSKAQRYLRYARYMGYSFIPSLLPYFILYLSGTLRVHNLGYQTPGLWEMTGAHFVSHFLFETPFVILRMSAGFLPVILLAVYLYYQFRFYALYKKTLAG